MPSIKGLELLIRKSQPTDKQWVRLIEARRDLIKPYLDSFTLTELGTLECLRRETFKHALRLDISTTTGDERFSLKTQGIFCVQPYSAVEKIPQSNCFFPERCSGCSNGKMRVWGLTRSGIWVLVTIDFVGECGYKNRGYERATDVEIVEADLPVIIKETKEKPQQMWEELGKAIIDFAEKRELLYRQVANLAKMVRIEELALSLIPNQT
jgi:hypothetical protein